MDLTNEINLILFISFLQWVFDVISWSSDIRFCQFHNHPSLSVVSYISASNSLLHAILSYHVILNIDGLVQDCSNSSALAMELLQSCTKPSICTTLQFTLSYSWWYFGSLKITFECVLHNPWREILLIGNLERTYSAHTVCIRLYLVQLDSERLFILFRIVSLALRRSYDCCNTITVTS